MAIITDNKAPGLVLDIDGRPLGPVHPSPRPGGQPSKSKGEPGLGAATIRHEQFRTADSQAAAQFFAAAYTPGWRFAGAAGRFAMTHRRCETVSATVDEVLIHGRATVEIPAGDSVIVIQPRAGSISVTSGSLPAADCPVLVAHGMSCGLRVNGARFDVVSIAPDALLKAVPEWGAPPSSHQVQFLGWRPRCPAAVRAWHRALDYVTASLASADVTHQPLIVAGLAPLLAGALLECYPSTLTEQDVAAESALPEALKDAVSFIHRHAAGDVGITDVAAAVHLTPRAVQYLFRRQLNTTPTEYMRRVRLNRAHQELIAGTPSTTTVTEIAQRCGFAHTGRFAVIYRQTYGQSPHTTLRQ